MINDKQRRQVIDHIENLGFRPVLDYNAYGTEAWNLEASYLGLQGHVSYTFSIHIRLGKAIDAIIWYDDNDFAMIEVSPEKVLELQSPIDFPMLLKDSGIDSQFNRVVTNMNKGEDNG